MRGYSAVCLTNPKTSMNVGSAMRAAGCFGSSVVFTTGDRYKSGKTDTFKAYRHIPLVRYHGEGISDIIPYDCVPIAVDLVEGATPLHEYKHPQRAIYVFGAEDETLNGDILDSCKDRVYIPTKGCLNLAACVNVVLYSRMAYFMKETL